MSPFLAPFLFLLLPCPFQATPSGYPLDPLSDPFLEPSRLEPLLEKRTRKPLSSAADHFQGDSLLKPLRITCGTEYLKMGKAFAKKVASVHPTGSPGFEHLARKRLLYKATMKGSDIAIEWLDRTSLCLEQLQSLEKSTKNPSLEQMDNLVSLMEDILGGFWPVESHIRPIQSTKRLDSFVNELQQDHTIISTIEDLTNLSHIVKTLPFPMDAYLGLMNARTYRDHLNMLVKMEKEAEKIGKEKGLTPKILYIHRELRKIAKELYGKNIFLPYAQPSGRDIKGHTGMEVKALQSMLEMDLENAYETFRRIKVDIPNHLQVYQNTIPNVICLS